MRDYDDDNDGDVSTDVTILQGLLLMLVEFQL